MNSKSLSTALYEELCLFSGQIELVMKASIYTEGKKRSV